MRDAVCFCAALGTTMTTAHTPSTPTSTLAKRPKRPLTSEQKDALAARLAQAREDLRTSGDTSTSARQRGKDKMRFALDWVYRWGWSSPSVIDLLSGAKRRGLCAKLVKAGFLIETKTASGAILEDIPSKIITLSERGITEAERFRETMLDYDTNPYKVNQSLLRHDTVAQRATANNMAQGKIIDFATPRELAAKSIRNMKQPDVMWVMPDNRKVAIEVELTAKYERKLDEFVLGIIISLQPKSDKPAKFDQCAIVTDSDAIIKRYKPAFESDHKVSRWVKNSQSKWSIDKTWDVPPWVKGKLSWVKVD